MGFPILQQDMKVHATLLGIEENPSPEKLLETLLESPPTSKEKAQQVFEYLLSVQAKFLDHQWTTLKTAKFISLDDTGESMVDPQSCYFYREDLLYRDLLITVDFGASANRFLKACGVKEDPSPVDLAQLIARSPDKYMQYDGVDRYRSTLRQIATHLDVIKTNESLMDEMKRSPFLLGEKMVNQDLNEAPSEAMAEGGQDAGFGHDYNMGQVVQYTLARASDIYLVDDSVLQQVFVPLCAPIEELLESLYEALGSNWISSQVKDTYEKNGQPKKTDRSYALQSLIVERAPLLLNGHPPSRLNFNLDWLTTKLKVLEVPGIRLHRKFLPRNQTKSEETTACIVKDAKDVYYLLIKDQTDMDYFDIADVLAKLLLRRKKLNDSIWWTNLLSSSLENLKRKGFQVDRILNAKGAQKARIEAEKATAATAGTSLLPSLPSKDTTAFGPIMQGTTTSTESQASRPSAHRGNSAEHQRHLQQSLNNAIARCRPHSERDLRCEPSVSQVPEALTNSYCDSRPLQSLKEAGHAGKLKFFIHKSCNKDDIKTKENVKSLERFAKLLLILAKDVFGLPSKSMHIMYDTEGQTIAFNRGGSLFFNWRFFISLGHDDEEGLAVKRKQGQRTVKARDEGLIYWFFTIAHELAHNIVLVHDSRHEYYMSSFCEQHLPALMDVMASLSKATV